MEPEKNINGETKMSLQGISVNSTSSVANRPYAGNKWTPILALSAAVSTFGFAVPAGYCLGVLNTPAKLLQQWCNETLIGERGINLTNSQFDILWSLIVSVFVIGGVVGGLTGAWFADRLGRWRLQLSRLSRHLREVKLGEVCLNGTLISGNVLNALSGVLFLCSKFVPSIEMFFVGRVVVGFVAGLMTTVVPMYLTELSPPKLSGLLGVLFPVGLTFGILISQIVGLDWLLGTETLWPYLISGYSMMSVFVFISLPWLPESPKYLFQIVKEEDKAMQELSRLRNLPTSVIAWEIIDDKSYSGRSTHEKWSLIRVLTTPRLRLPLSLVIALQAGQQFSGINAIFYFSTNIFETAGLTPESIPYANIGTGLINFCVTACGTLLVNSFGRRPLLIFSCSLTSLTLILLTFSSRHMNLAPWVPYLSVAIVLAFVFCYDLGLGPIPYFIGTELVDIGPRPVIMALGSVANWGGNFLVGASYTTLHNWLHEFIFLGFAFLTFLLIIFVIIYLPETKEPSISNDELAEEQNITEE